MRIGAFSLRSRVKTWFRVQRLLFSILGSGLSIGKHGPGGWGTKKVSGVVASTKQLMSIPTWTYTSTNVLTSILWSSEFRI